jgi:hypothetical protein
MKTIENVQNAWRTAAHELGFDFIAPYELEADGRTYLYHGFVRDFGGDHGTLFIAHETFNESFGDAPRVASEAGFFCSQINASVYGRYQRDVFIEVLSDWGWTRKDKTPPDWLAAAE